MDTNYHSESRSNLDHLKRIVIAVHDRFVAEGVVAVVEGLAPHAEWQLLVSAGSLRASLNERRADMVIASLDLREGDVIDALSDIRHVFACERILVVTDRWESQILHTLRSLGVRGAVDTRCEGLTDFRDAFCRVGCGETYWSNSFTQILHGQNARADVQRLLSPAELLLFAVLGDGCDDHAAATSLNLTAQGVHAYRKRLHRKLGLQHKGSLITLAIQTGLVRVTPNGIERPGFETLRARCFFRAKRPWKVRKADVRSSEVC